MPTRYAPGDLITSDLINQILDRLDALAGSATSARLLLGPLADDTHTLLALGTGFELSGGIYLDGVSLLPGPPARGINLVILDQTLNVKFRSSYDTLILPSESARLVSDLQTQVARYDVVCGVTHDAYQDQLSAAAKAALAAVGAAALGNATRTRDNAAFIGVAPANRSKVAFNYLVSVLPADDQGSTSALLAAQPFVWGLYSTPLSRFLLGGGSTDTLVPAPAKSKETLKEAGKEIGKEVIKEGDKVPDNKVGDGVKEREVTKDFARETKVPDVKTAEVTKDFSSEVKATEAKTGEVTKDFAREVKTAEAKATDTTKTAEVKTTEVKATEVKAQEVKAAEVKTTDTAKTADAKTTEVTKDFAREVKATDTGGGGGGHIVKAIEGGGTIGGIGGGAIRPQDEQPVALHPFIKPEERPNVEEHTLKNAEQPPDKPEDSRTERAARKPRRTRRTKSKA